METLFFFSADVIDKNSLHLHTALFLLAWRGDPAEAEWSLTQKEPSNSKKQWKKWAKKVASFLFNYPSQGFYRQRVRPNVTKENIYSVKASALRSPSLALDLSS